MFDLEESVTDWRHRMLAAGIKTPVPLEELEIHLRENIEQQVNKGLTAQEAFAVATRQIGTADLLNNEFKKDDKEARDRILHQLLLACCLCSCTLAAAMGLPQNGNLTSAQQMSGLCAVAVMNLLTLGGWWGYRLFPVIPSQRVRNAMIVSIGALGALWLTIFCNVILQTYEYTVGQLTLAVLWGTMLPVGILGGLIEGIETAAWKNRRHDASPRGN